MKMSDRLKGAIGVKFICTYDGGYKPDQEGYGHTTEGKVYTGFYANDEVWILNNFSNVEGYCEDCFELVD